MLPNITYSESNAAIEIPINTITNIFAPKAKSNKRITPLNHFNYLSEEQGLTKYEIHNYSITLKCPVGGTLNIIAESRVSRNRIVIFHI